MAIPNTDSEISKNVTVSLGVASRVPELPDTLDSFLRDADQRLYLAKDQGRDRVVVDG